MKPKFWIAKTDFASLSDENDGCDAIHQCATVSRNDCKLLPDDVPLYTADQLAEAVAAEMERVSEFLSSFWSASSLEEDDISVTVKIKVPFIPHEKTVSTIFRAIRSAAK